MKHLIVPIDDVIPNRWNPKKPKSSELKKVSNSLESFGQCAPVVCRRVGDKYEIIDGEQRWRAMKQAGAREISIIDLGEISDKDAISLTINMQDARIEFDKVALGRLLKEMNINAPSKRIPYKKAEIDLFNKLANKWAETPEGICKHKFVEVTICSICGKVLKK